MSAPYFSRDEITLYLGDCLEVMPQHEQVDHVITDPPYGIAAHTHGRRLTNAGDRWRRDLSSGCASSVETKFREQPIAFAALTPELREKASDEIARLTRRWALVFCQLEDAPAWAGELAVSGMTYRRTCLWIKPQPMPQITGDRPGTGCEAIATMHAPGRSRWNGGGRSNLFHHPSVRVASKTGHPTPKPLSLMLELVRFFTDLGETILDPFAGSGTTLVAAWRFGRNAIGVELSEQYAEVAARRLEAEMAQGRLALPEPLQQAALPFAAP